MADDPLNPGFEKGRGGYPNTRGAVVTTVARDVLTGIANGAKNLWNGLLGASTGGPKLTQAGGLPGTPNPPYGPGQTR